MKPARCDDPVGTPLLTCARVERVVALCVSTWLWCAGCVAPPNSVADDAAGGDAVPIALFDGSLPDRSEALDAALVCPGVPPGGLCRSTVLFSCAAGDITEEDCASSGQQCLHWADASARCGPPPTGCETLPPGGMCADDQLYVCHGNALSHLPCDELGGRCALMMGQPGCEPLLSGSRQVSGRITLDKRPYTTQGLGPGLTAPAEGVLVVAHRQADGAALNFGITDALGHYAIPYDIGAGPDGIRVRVMALNFTDTQRLWVTDRADATYAVTSQPTDDSTGPVVIDLHVSEAEGAGALNIFAVLFRNLRAVSNLVEGPLPSLQAVWEQGEAIGCGTCFSKLYATLFFLGTPQDTDEYDDCVISHEFGHYLQWAFSRDDSPGGVHDGTPTDPRLAWSEGLASWIGLTLLDVPLYVDTKATGATVWDPENVGWDADPAGGMSQSLSEYVVVEILWDMTDPADATDPMQRPVTDVMAVLTSYLPSPTLVDRGVQGVDLVDFLDGWFCLGKGDQGGVAALVVADQGFPYDFQGPQQPCPKPTEPVSLRLQRLRGGRSFRLTVIDRLGTSKARAILKVPPTTRVSAHSRTPRALGALAPSTPYHVTWQLEPGPGPGPAWIIAGVQIDRGARGVDHQSVRLQLIPSVHKPRIRRLHLGGLLRLREPL